MKKIIITLAAAMICMSACKKQSTPTPVSVVQTETVTEDDFNGSKATTLSIQNKKSGEGLEMDYDIIIKQVSEHKYVAAMKYKGLLLNGKSVKGSKDIKVHGAELSLKSGKKDENVPLTSILESNEPTSISHDKVITFPVFEYAGELIFEIVSPTGTIIVDGDLVISNGLSTINIGDLNITPEKTALVGSNVDIKENSNVVIAGNNTPVTFGISYLATNKGKVRLTEESPVFVLPSGHTLVQEPKISKVKTQDETGNVVVTISGDPAMAIKTVYYQPAPISGKEQPVMKFEATHYNMKNGIQRYKSTQTWEQVYGKTTAPNWAVNTASWANIYTK